MKENNLISRRAMLAKGLKTATALGLGRLPWAPPVILIPYL